MNKRLYESNCDTDEYKISHIYITSLDKSLLKGHLQNFYQKFDAIRKLCIHLHIVHVIDSNNKLAILHIAICHSPFMPHAFFFKKIVDEQVSRLQM